MKNVYFLSVEKRFRLSLLPLSCANASPEGDGALLAMAPEQIIQHYRKGGCPFGGGTNRYRGHRDISLHNQNVRTITQDLEEEDTTRS